VKPARPLSFAAQMGLAAALGLAACGGAAPPAPATAPPAAVPPAAGDAPALASLPPAAPPVQAGALGLGSPATEAEIAAWDIDVLPDGRGLPPGRGTVDEGRALYAAQCVACHGVQGEGSVGPKLVGAAPKDGFGDDWKSHPRTIGNWWPYATTVFDYVRRAMPQYAPGSLTADQTYALTAFLLAENGIVGADFVADAASLPAVKMGTTVVFVRDDREGSTAVR
jgi:cytochrome c